MDGERSKTIARLLQSATNNTPRYYGNDVKTAAQLLNHVLQYESRQAGFDLTAMRDADFNEVENLTGFTDLLLQNASVITDWWLSWMDSNWEHWWHTALHWLISLGEQLDTSL